MARLEDEALTVAIIPHTYEHTTVPAWASGEKVNLEFDMIGKYVVGWLERRGSAASELTADLQARTSEVRAR